MKSNCESLLGPHLRDFLRHMFEVNSCGLYTAPVRDERANAVATNKTAQQQRPRETYPLTRVAGSVQVAAPRPIRERRTAAAALPRAAAAEIPDPIAEPGSMSSRAPAAARTAVWLSERGRPSGSPPFRRERASSGLRLCVFLRWPRQTRTGQPSFFDLNIAKDGAIRGIYHEVNC